MADNLRYDYTKSRHNVDVDEWPPNQPKTVVNVALIHYQGLRTEQELIEISKRHKEGTHAVDELSHHSRVTKDIAKIFTAEFSKETGAISGKPPKFILIEGTPGIGKTVLAKNIAYLWATKKFLTDVDILFLLFLRDPKMQNIKTPEQLIQYVSRKRLNDEQLEKCVDQIEELKVGIVMDGFDEYPIKLRKKSFVADIIKGKVFRNCIVVLTSRPTATLSLHDENPDNRRVEILGFAQEERDKYISESLDSPEQQKQLQDYLKFQPIINGLVYVPLHLAILLYLFKVQSKLPETLTEMNELFILHTIYRNLARDELTSASVIFSMSDLPKDVSDIVTRLSQLAFVGLQNNQLVFSYNEIKANCPEIEKDIPGALNGFGLLQVVQHFPERGVGSTVSFNFLHFTMQEYLAALHVSNIAPYQQQLSLMKDTFWNGMYSFMWMMYVGINGINSQTFLKFLYNSKPGADIMELTMSSDIKSDKLKCLYLFQCFMEAKSKNVPKEICLIFHNNEINFRGLQLLPHHISSLTLYVSKYSMQLQSLNLRDCHIGDVGMSILEHYFTANPDKASSIKHIDLFGNNSVLLWNVYCAIFGQKNLAKLNWSSLGGVNIEEIANFMDNNTTVQSLNLSDNHFNDSDAENLVKVLGKNNMLQQLDFSNNDITTKGATAISESLQKLKHLKMSWNNHVIDTNHSSVSFAQKCISDVDAHIVAEVLYSNETVTKLDLSQNRISKNGAISISKCIKHNKTLKELDVSKNKISNIGLKKIAVAMQANQTLQKFNFSYSNLSDNGTIAISECLKHNNTLQELKISRNKLSINGIISISNTLQTHSTLQALDISYNNISDDGAVAICQCLKNNNTLQQLNMSGNEITSEGVVIILESIHSNSKLKSLNLIDNNICKSELIMIHKIYKNLKSITSIQISYNKIVGNSHNIEIIIEYLDSEELLQSAIKMKFNTENRSRRYKAKVLCSCAKDSSSVKELDISNHDISSKETKMIFKTVHEKTSLQILNISHNNISDDGAKAIGEVLRSHCRDNSMTTTIKGVTNEDDIRYSTLQKLNMSYNNISSEGIVALSDYLKNSNTLQQLTISWDVYETPLVLDGINMYANMSGKYFGDIGIILMSAFLFHNDRVQKIDISHNNISDYGAQAISEYLESNITLKEFNMSNNEITNHGIVKIAKAIKKNTTLRLLDISHNNLSRCKEVVMTLSGYLKCNNALTNLVVSWKDSDTAFIYVIGKNECYICNTYSRPNYNSSAMQMSQFSDTEAFLLVALIHGNTNIREVKIVRKQISYYAALVISDFLKADKTLQEFKLSHNMISNKCIELTIKAVESNTTLQMLDISFNDISDDGAVAISELLMINNTLRELNMSHNKVSDNGITNIGKALQMNRKLQVFNISANNICDDGAVAISEYLKYNNSLQELNMSHNKVSDNGIINIGKALQMNATLQILDISHNSLSDNGVLTFSDYLKEENTLHQLRISWNDIDLDLNSNVELLNMYRKGFGNTGAILVSKFFCYNTNMLKLDISYNNISDDGAVAISECLKNNNTLQELNMLHNEVCDNGIINISKALHINRKLRVFNISANKIFDDGAIAISECLKVNNTLQELNMSHNKVSDNGIINIGKALQMNATLQILDISHNSLSDNGVLTFSDYLKEENTLHQLRISWNDIDLDLNSNVELLNMYRKGFGNTGAILVSKFFCYNTNMLKLDISYNNISDDGAVAISECLKNNNTLQELNMLHNEVCDNGIINISKALHINRKLRVFNISANKIFDDGAIAISECLKVNNTLQELNMSHNKVSDNGIINIGKALQMNATLQILDISHNSLSDNGVLKFSDYLKKENTLHQLRISWNNINVDLNSNVTLLNMCRKRFGNTGAILVSKFLYYNLLKLNISYNCISDDGAVAISECLKNNNTLQKLDMSHNNISDNGIINIGKALQVNGKLQIFDVSSNNISDDGAVAFSKCLPINNTLQELSLSWNSTTKEGITKIAEAIAVNTGLHTLDLSSQCVTDPVHFTMTLLTAVEHNHTMMRLVLPSTDNKNEAMKEKISKVNEGRINKDIRPLSINFRRDVNFLRYELAAQMDRSWISELLVSRDHELLISRRSELLVSHVHQLNIHDSLDYPSLVSSNYVSLAFVSQLPHQLPIQLPSQRPIHAQLPFQRPIQRYQRRRQMLTSICNVPPRIRRFNARARATRNRHRQKSHSHKFK